LVVRMRRGIRDAWAGRRLIPLNGHLLPWDFNLTSVARIHINQKGQETKTSLTSEDYSMDFTLDTGIPNMYLPTPLYEPW
jgi:hypothetical protein